MKATSGLLTGLASFALFCSAASSQETTAQQATSTKRGISYHTETPKDDYKIFYSANSPTTWYYNWAPYPRDDIIPSDSRLEFIPMIWSNKNIDKDVKSLSKVPKSTQHLLSFNEPDASSNIGGSSISPQEAAQAYIKHILPLRHTEGGRFQISHPVVTGTQTGLQWLRNFNASCYALRKGGCPTDFIAAHYYGNFEGLAAWLGQLLALYNDNSISSDRDDLKVWLTEWAVPQETAAETMDSMNWTMNYLDNWEHVEKYAWFGMFRNDNYNAFTGKNVALLDQDGGLTDLGAMYLGGEQKGFEAGQRDATSGSSRTFGDEYNRLAYVLSIMTTTLFYCFWI